jgi:energy-coupling factor transporter ATP-binding protein EcfA2
MATHDLERGWGLVDRVVVLADGRVVYDQERPGIDLGTFGEIYRVLTHP